MPELNPLSLVPADPEAEALAAARMPREDIALVGKAVRLGWPIPDAVRSQIVGNLVTAATDPALLQRGHAIAAAKVLLAMAAANLAAEGPDAGRPASYGPVVVVEVVVPTVVHVQT